MYSKSDIKPSFKAYDFSIQVVLPAMAGALEFTADERIVSDGRKLQHICCFVLLSVIVWYIIHRYTQKIRDYDHCVNRR